jgi:tetratricopeptide (TPR) repeat protein
VSARAPRLAICAVLAVCGPAQAAPAPAKGAEAQRAQAYVDLGTSLFKKRLFEAALSEFERAEPLVPQVATRAIVRYNIARCLEELARPEEAVAALDRYLALPDEAAAQATAREKRARLLEKHFGKLRIDAHPSAATCRLTRRSPPPTSATPTTCPMRETPVLAGEYVAVLGGPGPESARALSAPPVEERVVVARGQTTYATLSQPAWLRVEIPEPGTTALVDDAPFGAAPRAEGALTAGAHGLRVLQGAEVLWRTELSLSPGEARVVTVPLAGSDGVAIAEPPASRGPWPWVALGGAALTLAGSGFFYASALSALDQGDSAMKDMAAAQTETDYAAARTAVRDHDDDARLNRTLALGLGVTGLALVGVTTWLFLRTPSGPDSTPAVAADAPLSVRF